MIRQFRFHQVVDIVTLICLTQGSCSLPLSDKSCSTPYTYPSNELSPLHVLSHLRIGCSIRSFYMVWNGNSLFIHPLWSNSVASIWHQPKMICVQLSCACSVLRLTLSPYQLRNVYGSTSSWSISCIKRRGMSRTVCTTFWLSLQALRWSRYQYGRSNRSRSSHDKGRSVKGSLGSGKGNHPNVS